MPLPTPERESKRPEFKEFKRPVWFVPTKGHHRIRLLQPLSEAYIQYVHWVERQRNYVNCLGDAECPICLENKKIEMEYPENYSKQPGWNHFSTKYNINVLDRTLVKICPNCNSENKATSVGASNDFLPTCWKCSTSIMSVPSKPSNTVKILSRLPSLFRDGFESFEKTVLDAEGNPIPMTSYDIVLNVTKKERGWNIMPVPQPHMNDEVSVMPEDLFDLEESMLKLTSDEVRQYLRGVSLKDIFTARNAEASAIEKSEKVASAEEDLASSAQDAVTNLFNTLG